MSQEILEIAKQLNINSFATQLALQCAPLITGLKISNLFTIKSEYLTELSALLDDSDLSYYILYSEDEKITLLLYRYADLEQYLSQKEISLFLQRFGYHTTSLPQILKIFQLRFQECRTSKFAFPHEMGILLGYPIQDVEGFIENQGKNCLLTGYWKVYEDMAEKMNLFREFELAEAALIRLMMEGRNLHEIMRIYHLA